MKKIILFLAACAFAACSSTPTTLKDATRDYFYIGAAVNTRQMAGDEPKAEQVLDEQFSSIVAENCMKISNLQPREGEFTFDDADRFVEFGEKHNMFIIGHNLVWHTQVPDWFFLNEDGSEVSREKLIERMRTHITTVVTRYKGRVDGWDVVNEALNNDGTMRKTKFYEIIGPEYIDLAYQFAHEADPEVELYYNDFSMARASKCDGAIRIVKRLIDKGIRIDAVGMQCHYTVKGPAIEDIQASFDKIAALGLKVMVTELDITILPSANNISGANVADKAEYSKALNPYPAGDFPSEMIAAWEARYISLFELFKANSDKISRVTLWGVHDAMSWKNDWPVKGRTDYPLLFDTEYQAKPVVGKIIELFSARE